MTAPGPHRRRTRGDERTAAEGSGTSDRRGGPDDHRDPRGSRDLAGAGPSAVGVDGALRARDVNRPTDEDLAEAERNLVIVRRHWQPPKS